MRIDSLLWPSGEKVIDFKDFHDYKPPGVLREEYFPQDGTGNNNYRVQGAWLSGGRLFYMIEIFHDQGINLRDRENYKR